MQVRAAQQVGPRKFYSRLIIALPTLAPLRSVVMTLMAALQIRAQAVGLCALMCKLLGSGMNANALTGTLEHPVPMATDVSESTTYARRIFQRMHRALTVAPALVLGGLHRVLKLLALPQSAAKAPGLALSTRLFARPQQSALTPTMLALVSDASVHQGGTRYWQPSGLLRRYLRAGPPAGLLQHSRRRRRRCRLVCRLCSRLRLLRRWF